MYAFGHRSSLIWEMSQSYHVVWGPKKYRWGALIQLSVYAASTAMSAVFFALVPPASVGVRDPDWSRGLGVGVQGFVTAGAGLRAWELWK